MRAIHAAQCLRGAVVAPHHSAAQSGLRVLREGGNAIEAMIAAAAAIPVVYPHMNSIGGDGFWLIAKPDEEPIAIDACGGAAQLATRGFYKDHGCEQIPSRGPLAALTVAGTISGWRLALDFASKFGGRFPLSRLLEDAIGLARDGTPVSHSQADAMANKAGELDDVSGYAETYFIAGQRPKRGDILRQPRLADTLDQLVRAGLSDFYTGDIAQANASDLEQLGSPVRRGDFAEHKAQQVKPLSLSLEGMRIFNMPPPTQGLASLLILGIFDRLSISEAESFDHVHGLIEATKQAFVVRDRYVTDPAYMTTDPADFLASDEIDRMAARIDRGKASDWHREAAKGDTVWMGAVDGDGLAVSFIQSVYWEFGSGVVLPTTGILWQNRGTSFSLKEDGVNRLEPGRKPFHTLNPAMAQFSDGRHMVYGAMGGDGQPQTLAALFTRYGRFGQDLQQSVSAPRWVLGRRWGVDNTKLQIEARLDPAICSALIEAGHEIELVDPVSEIMGHAGAIVRHQSGLIEGASDPRSDGCVACF